MRTASRRRSGDRPASTGQGLVEFALVLPVLLLILLFAIDFGRAFYGWIVVQNASRIAANFAALNPEGWQGTGNPAIVDAYRAQIQNDTAAANCDPQNPPPDPVFSDGPDQAVPGGPADTSYDVGDTVTVQLSCAFHPITPIISAVVGNTVQLSASSEFRIRTGTVTGLADPTTIPPPPTPTPTPTATPAPTTTPGPTATPAPTPTPVPCSLTASFTRTGNGVVKSGDTVTFTSTSTATGCTIASYSWSFPNGNPTMSASASQDVVFTVNKQQDVTVQLTVTSNTGLARVASLTIKVQP